MRAAVIQDDLTSIKVQEVPTPEVEPGHVLLKTIYCSICGTDIEFLDGSLNNIPGFEHMSTTAAAPSFSVDELPAVHTPSA